MKTRRRPWLPTGYRPVLDMDKVLEEINKKKGNSYDPDVVDVCSRIIKTEKMMAALEDP